MIAAVVESIAVSELIPSLKGRYASDENSDMQVRSTVYGNMLKWSIGILRIRRETL
jgi:hypothetical protein